MNPDRLNYEIWFTDWLDGNLNEKQVDQLRNFLNLNPDLEEELSGLYHVVLKKPEIVFKGKNDLLGLPENLSRSQIEKLFIGYLENDLIPEQEEEMNRIIEFDERNRKSFELYQQLKLKPISLTFAIKNKLKKQALPRKILRISLTGFSIAATIALVLSLFPVRPGNNLIDLGLADSKEAKDTFLLKVHPDITLNEIEPATDPQKDYMPNRRYLPETSFSNLKLPPEEPEILKIADSVTFTTNKEAFSSIPPEIIPEIMVAGDIPFANSLRELNTLWIPPLIDNRSNVEIFLAKFFHSKIMKDTDSGSRPVESIELAQAGITGLNKLFGWKIALLINTDEKGEIKSYNFSSRFLKINAPVKKTGDVL
jgi:hypothetical protein